MPRIEQSITVDAPVEKVYAIARDVELFPDIMDDLQSIAVLERSDDGYWHDYRVGRPGAAVQDEAQVAARGPLGPGAPPRRLQSAQGRCGRALRLLAVHVRIWRHAIELLVDYEINVPLVGPLVKNLIRKLMETNLAAQMQAIKDKADNMLL